MAELLPTLAPVSDPPVEYLPETMEQAVEWIRQLRDAYNRETAYVKRLEAELHRQRDVVEFAVYWARARGIHKTRWLDRWKEVAKSFAAELGDGMVGVLPNA